MTGAPKILKGSCPCQGGLLYRLGLDTACLCDAR